MRYGMNMLLWTGDCTGPKFPALFERLKKTGFDLVEIPIFDPNVKKLSALAKKLDGIKVPVIRLASERADLRPHLLPILKAAAEQPVTPGDYENPNYKQFVIDMLKAGREPYHYHGRNFYRGPAVNVRVHEFEDVARETRVRLQTDSMGLGMVVYPR